MRILKKSSPRSPQSPLKDVSYFLMKKPLFFFGSGRFALPCLQALSASNDFSIQTVFTQKTSTPVRQLASKLGFHIADNCELSVIKELFQNQQPLLGMVIDFGEILSPDVLSLFPYGCINLHASLLPQYRGASPIQTALLHGDTLSGLTLIQMNAKMDQGDIVAQMELPLFFEDTARTVIDRFSHIGATFLLENLPKIFDHSLKPRPQDAHLASYCTKITRRDAEIHWSKYSALEIIRRFKAFDPWPGLYTFFRGKRLKISSISFQPLHENFFPPGKVFCKNTSDIFVQTRDDAVELLEVQLEGKKTMPINTFLLGAADFVDAQL